MISMPMLLPSVSPNSKQAGCSNAPECSGKTRVVVLNSHLHFLRDFDLVLVMGESDATQEQQLRLQEKVRCLLFGVISMC